MTAFAIRSRAGSPACASAATASETCSLIISQYCAGDRVTSSTPTSHSAMSRSPASSYRALTYPGAAHRNIFGPSRSGGATTASVAIACMAIVVHGFSSGLTHTDEQRRPPGLSTRANSAVALATSGKNMYPKRTETLSNVASLNGKSSALHTVVSILVTPCALARRAAMSSISATRSVSTTRPFGESLAMLMVFSDVETLDNRCADRAQLIHDHRVPLLPARREPGPRRSLNVSDLIGVRHRPSPYRCIHRTGRYSWRERIMPDLEHQRGCAR